MADSKDKKPGSGSVALTFGEIFFTLLVLTAISRILYYIYEKLFIGADGGAGAVALWWENFVAHYEPLLPLIRISAVILTGIFTLGIIYVVRETNKIWANERRKLYPEKEEAYSEDGAMSFKNKKWNLIEKKLNSNIPSDWRLAILEADIMLDELLDNLGYRGESMSDKLKSIEKSDFLTLDLAWEAHKIRNQIAHEGADIAIDEREARRVIGLYEQVFKEFKFI